METVFHTPNACAGSATAYIIRRIAISAGVYQPTLQQDLFHELHTTREGGSIEKVQRWFSDRVSLLHQLGYRLQLRRAAVPTAAIADWVRAGRGYRGAMLPTTFAKLHTAPGAAGADAADDMIGHAVGLAVDPATPGATAKTDTLVMIDPWPGFAGDADRTAVPEALEAAHRDKNFHALALYWVGWS